MTFEETKSQMCCTFYIGATCSAVGETAPQLKKTKLICWPRQHKCYLKWEISMCVENFGILYLCLQKYVRIYISPTRLWPSFASEVLRSLSEAIFSVKLGRLSNLIITAVKRRGNTAGEPPDLRAGQHGHLMNRRTQIHQATATSPPGDLAHTISCWVLHVWTDRCGEAPDLILHLTGCMMLPENPKCHCVATRGKVRDSGSQGE